MDLETHEPKQRRRGAELEKALLDAAYEELFAVGYDGFTIDGVATRAGTSRPVIYRRWPGKAELVRAAITHGINRDRVELPDTGSVRDDLVLLLRRANQQRAGIAAVLAMQASALYRDTGATLADLREEALGDRVATSGIVLQRGVDRGEIDPDKLTPRILSLPFDLFRHELIFTMKPVSDATIDEIIDTIFLPLVRRDPSS